MNPSSLEELSVQVRLMVFVDAAVAFKFVGAGGVPLGVPEVPEIVVALATFE